MAVPEKIMDEARRMIRMLSRARQAAEDVDQHKPPRPAVFIGEVIEEMRQVGRIAPSTRPADAFVEGLKFWAERVAAELTFDEWDEMTEALSGEFSSETQVDVIGFMENLFDGREMKDGQTVWA